MDERETELRRSRLEGEEGKEEGERKKWEKEESTMNERTPRVMYMQQGKKSRKRINSRKSVRWSAVPVAPQFVFCSV